MGDQRARPGVGPVTRKPEAEAHTRSESCQVALDPCVRANGQAEALALGIPGIEEPQPGDVVEDSVDIGFGLGPTGDVEAGLELGRDRFAGLRKGILGGCQDHPTKAKGQKCGNDQASRERGRHEATLHHMRTIYPTRGGPRVSGVP